MERVVLPFSGLASWVLILGGVLATLQVLGINIQPLLTVGGVSGIVVGLSAQSVMSNMISGINLVSHPVHGALYQSGDHPMHDTRYQSGEFHASSLASIW